MIPCAYFSATLTQPIAIQVLLSLRPGRMNFAPKPMNMISDLREVVCVWRDFCWHGRKCLLSWGSGLIDSAFLG